MKTVIAIVLFVGPLAWGQNCGEILLASQQPMSIQVSIMDRAEAEEIFGTNLDEDAKSFLWVRLSVENPSPIRTVNFHLKTSSEVWVEHQFFLANGTLTQLFGMRIPKETVLALQADRQIVPQSESTLYVSIDLGAPSPVEPTPIAPAPVISQSATTSGGNSSSGAGGGQLRVVQPGYESYAHGQHQTSFQRGQAEWVRRTGLSSHFYK